MSCGRVCHHGTCAPLKVTARQISLAGGGCLLLLVLLRTRWLLKGLMCRARESGAGRPEAPPDAWMLGMQAGGGDAHKTSTGYW